MKHVKWLVVVALVVLSGMAVAQLSGNSRIVAQVPLNSKAARSFTTCRRAEPRLNCAARTYRPEKRHCSPLWNSG
jgi:hypothetical protein